MKKKISELPLDTPVLVANLDDYMHQGQHARHENQYENVEDLKDEWEYCVEEDGFDGTFDEWLKHQLCLNDGDHRRVVVALVDGKMEFIM